MSKKISRRDFLRLATTAAAGAGAAAVIPAERAEAAEKRFAERSGKARASQPECAVCGKTSAEAWLVAVINPFNGEDEAELAYVCRSGHFKAVQIDALTGVPVRMSGPVESAPSVALFMDDWFGYVGIGSERDRRELVDAAVDAGVVAVEVDGEEPPEWWRSRIPFTIGQARAMLRRLMHGGFGSGGPVEKTRSGSRGGFWAGKGSGRW